MSADATFPATIAADVGRLVVTLDTPASTDAVTDPDAPKASESQGAPTASPADTPDTPTPSPEPPTGGEPPVVESAGLPEATACGGRPMCQTPRRRNRIGVSTGFRVCSCRRKRSSRSSWGSASPS